MAALDKMDALENLLNITHAENALKALNINDEIPLHQDEEIINEEETENQIVVNNEEESSHNGEENTARSSSRGRGIRGESIIRERGINVGVRGGHVGERGRGGRGGRGGRWGRGRRGGRGGKGGRGGQGWRGGRGGVMARPKTEPGMPYKRNFGGSFKGANNFKHLNFKTY